MIDKNFKAWLIEINTNPCLETSCPLLARLIPSLVEHAFQIAIDPLFPPPEPFPNYKRNQTIAYLNPQKNKFSIILDEEEEFEQLQSYLFY